VGYLIPSLCWGAYLLVGAYSARSWFGAVRPYREPIKCSVPALHCKKDDHYGSCYERVDTIDSAGIATFVVVVGGLGWPVTWLVVLVGPRLKRWFTAASPDLPEEVAAKVDRMEHDLGLGDR
jgi:hypothetical protein